MSQYRITFATGEGQRSILLVRVLQAASAVDARTDFERIFRGMYPKHLVTKCEALE
jgi:hypothetical protein